MYIFYFYILYTYFILFLISTYLVCVCLFTARPFSPDTVQHTVCSYGSLDIWTIVRLTATKFESFVFSVLSFTFSYAANIHIIIHIIQEEVGEDGAL
jgi:hypothetical protein